MTMLDRLGTLNRVRLKGGEHLYWPYNRVTLCGLNKIHALTIYHWQAEQPTCRDCLSVVGDIVMEEKRRERLAA